LIIVACALSQTCGLRSRTGLYELKKSSTMG